jgi:predicted DNA-binding protein (UPF0251 family)
MAAVRVFSVNEAARKLGVSRYIVHRLLLKAELTPAWVNENPGVLEDEVFEAKRVELEAQAAVVAA